MNRKVKTTILGLILIAILISTSSFSTAVSVQKAVNKTHVDILEVSLSD